MPESGQVAQFNAGEAFIVAASFNPEQVQREIVTADPDGGPESWEAALRKRFADHIACVRAMIPPELRGRKRMTLSNREAAWVAGVPLRTYMRNLAKSRTVPSGIVRKPRPCSPSDIRRLAKRCPDPDAYRLLESAAEMLELAS